MNEAITQKVIDNPAIMLAAFTKYLNEIGVDGLFDLASSTLDSLIYLHSLDHSVDLHDGLYLSRSLQGLAMELQKMTIPPDNN